MDVLIVEDEEALLESLVEGLASAFTDLNVLGAGSAEEADALMTREMPRLVVSDVRLPGKDGVQLLLSVRERSPKTPFIFMSAFPSPDAQEQARTRGIRFLSKPFEFEELTEAIGETLDESQFSGEVCGISLVDLLQVLNMGRRTAAVTLERRGEVGRIYLQDGEVVHAEVADVAGREAFDRLMAWKGGSFGSEPGRTAPTTSIAEPFNGLLLDSFRLMDEGDDLDGDIDQVFGGDFAAEGSPEGGAAEPSEGPSDADLHRVALGTIPGCQFSARIDLQAPALLGFAAEGELEPALLDLLPTGAAKLLGEGALDSLDRRLARVASAGETEPAGVIDEAIVLSSDMIYVFQRVPDAPGHAYVSVCETSVGLGTVVAKARGWRRSHHRRARDG